MTPRTAEDDAPTGLVTGHDGPRPGTVDVWWAALTQLRPTHVPLLDARERARADTFVRRADHDRFVLGCVLLRSVAGALLGVDPRDVGVDRGCDDCGEQHGRPVLLDAPWHVSVSHSGPHVVVATSLVELGVDVEWTGSRPVDVDALRRSVLAPAERARPVGADPWRDLLARWVAKESALKATGRGLRTPMTDVLVPAPHEGAGRVRLPGTVGRSAHVVWTASPPDALAAVTTLGAGPVVVRTRTAGPPPSDPCPAGREPCPTDRWTTSGTAVGARS